MVNYDGPALSAATPTVEVPEEMEPDVVSAAGTLCVEADGT